MKVIARREWCGVPLERHPSEFELTLEDGTPLGRSIPWWTTVQVTSDLLAHDDYFTIDTEVEVLIRSILDEIPLVCDMEVEWR